MRARRVLVVVGVVLLSGCQADAVGGPSPSPRAPWRPYISSDCQLDATICSAIQAGINALRNEQDPTCGAIADRAQQRMNSTDGSEGFRPAPDQNTHQGDAEMSVFMERNFSYPSLMGPSDGYINVYNALSGSAAMTDARAMGGLIAHEETHQTGEDDIYHNTGAAGYWQSKCQQS